MKKILTILLALLLAVMPVISLAEGSGAVRTTLSWEAQQGGVNAWLTAIGLSQTELDDWTDPLTDLLNVLGVSATLNNDASGGRIAFTLSDWEAFSMDFVMQGGKLYACYSFLPSYAVEFDLSAAEQAATVSALATQAPELQEALTSWVNDLPKDEEQGTFVADAYTCASRTVVTITDADLVDLFARLTACVAGEDAAAQVTAQLQSLTEQNSGRVQLILGRDDEGVLTGLSLTLGTVENTLITLSVGMSNDELTLVAGCGLQGDTWYLTAVANSCTLTVDLQRMSGSASYRLVRQSGEKYLSFAATMDLADDFSALSLISSLTLPNGGVLGQTDTLSSDPEQGRMLWTEAVTSGTEGTLAWTSRGVIEAVDAVTLPDISQRTAISVMDVLQDQAVLAEAQSELTSLATQLMRHAPLSVLLLVMQFMF